jgi:hypothetical protein
MFSTVSFSSIHSVHSVSYCYDSSSSCSILFHSVRVSFSSIHSVHSVSYCSDSSSSSCSVPFHSVRFILFILYHTVMTNQHHVQYCFIQFESRSVRFILFILFHTVLTHRHYHVQYSFIQFDSFCSFCFILL